MGLPALEDVVHDAKSLEDALSVLFEHSTILSSTLVPQITDRLSFTEISSYDELIDMSVTQIGEWDASLQTQFVAGHPRIGQVQNLSNLSAKEQGDLPSPEVLARLEHLNMCYERRYPGLLYITFVNGRSRGAIAEEMEDKLGLSHSLSTTEPRLEMVQPVDITSPEWSAELERAVYDVGWIAKSRMAALGAK